MDMILNVSESKIGQIISARELYNFLEVKSNFRDWIARRIVKYGFKENEDFIATAQKRATAQGNMTTESEYLLTMDMAKELSMIENNEKGRQARKYFIACEKKYVHMLEAKLNQLEVVAETPKKEKDWGIATLKRNIRKAETIEKEIEKLIGELKTHYEEIEKVSAMKADSFTGTYQIFRNSESEKRMLKKGE